MEIKYTIHGITLNAQELSEIHNYYEAACTAEYLMDNYDIKSEKEAMRLGYEVRRLMDKYGHTETEAIDEVLLPNELSVNCYDVADDWYELEEQEQEEAISDYLSDTYDFCHYGFEYEVDGDKIHISNIKWDLED